MDRTQMLGQREELKQQFRDAVNEFKTCRKAASEELMAAIEKMDTSLILLNARALVQKKDEVTALVKRIQELNKELGIQHDPDIDLRFIY